MWSELRQDYRRYPGPALRRVRSAVLSQGFWAVAAFRVSHAIASLPRPGRIALSVLWLPMSKLVECLTGIEIGATAKIGPGLYIGHFGGIVVSGHATIGAHCNLSPGVVIGVAGRGAGRGVPTIGNRVYVAPGAKLFGRISVGDGSAIGANAVVNLDVPPAVTVGGVPAKIISSQGSNDLIDVHDLVTRVGDSD